MGWVWLQHPTHSIPEFDSSIQHAASVLKPTLLRVGGREGENLDAAMDQAGFLEELT